MTNKKRASLKRRPKKMKTKLLFSPATYIVEVRVSGLNVAREWHILVPSNNEIRLSRYWIVSNEKLMFFSITRRSFLREFIVNSRYILVDSRCVVDCIEINLSKFAPTYEIKETATLEPHFILLLFHYIFECKLAADLAGT